MEQVAVSVRHSSWLCYSGPFNYVLFPLHLEGVHAEGKNVSVQNLLGLVEVCHQWWSAEHFEHMKVKGINIETKTYSVFLSGVQWSRLTQGCLIN